MVWVVTGDFLLCWGTDPCFCTDACFCYSFMSKPFIQRSMKPPFQNDFCMLVVSKEREKTDNARQREGERGECRVNVYKICDVSPVNCSCLDGADNRGRVIQRTFAKKQLDTVKPFWPCTKISWLSSHDALRKYIQSTQKDSKDAVQQTKEFSTDSTSCTN